MLTLLVIFVWLKTESRYVNLSAQLKSYANHFLPKLKPKLLKPFFGITRELMVYCIYTTDYRGSRVHSMLHQLCEKDKKVKNFGLAYKANHSVAKLSDATNESNWVNKVLVVCLSIWKL